jgi:hypothetical protein
MSQNRFHLSIFLLLAAMLCSASRAAPGAWSVAGPAARDAAPAEAAVLLTMVTFRQAIALGDSAVADAAFTRSAWIQDAATCPARWDYVHLAGCRGWCRPAPPLRHYQVSVLADSTTALAVETYSQLEPVSRRTHRGRWGAYTAVSVLVRQHSRWLISTQTVSHQPPD